MTAKDFFLNLGAIVALFVVVGNLISLLFIVINRAFPLVTEYYYYASSSISFPVSSLIVVFPLYILLMWLLGRDCKINPEKKHLWIRKWLTYFTLFVTAIAFVGDIITVLYYFLDGQEITIGFILKVLSILVIALAVFLFYIKDASDKLNSTTKKIWLIIGIILVVLPIIWGFVVLGSPRIQQLIKHDSQKINDLQNLVYTINNYYLDKEELPDNLTDLNKMNYYLSYQDKQTGKSYEYNKIGELTYTICAEFNRDSQEVRGNSIINTGMDNWSHPAGKYCFEKKVSTFVKSTY